MVESFVTQGEAHEIAKSVVKYWALRGYPVQADVEASEIEGRRVFVVKSDMVNGFPKGFPLTWAALRALRAFGSQPSERAA